MAFLQNNFRCPPTGKSKNLKDLKAGKDVRDPDLQCRILAAMSGSLGLFLSPVTKLLVTLPRLYFGIIR